MPERLSHFEERFCGLFGLDPLLPGIAVFVDEEETGRLEAAADRNQERRAGGSDLTILERDSGRGALMPLAMAALERMSDIAISGCVAELPMRSVRTAPMPYDVAGTVVRVSVSGLPAYEQPASCPRGAGRIAVRSILLSSC